LMAGNLTNQVRNIAEVTTAVAKGDLSKKITVDVKGEILELKNTINTMVDQLNSFASEVTRVSREVGLEGKLGGQAQVKGVAGAWKDLTDNVNLMAGNLTSQVRNIAEVTTAVAKGDLSKKITVDVKGEILELKSTINTMVDQLNSFASEVTRVSREVGSEGKLGGQAQVKGVAGAWKDLTDNVNLMAGNLTNQVRNIAAVTTAVASGDLSKKITVDVKGEILELKNTINTMVDQLNSFASEVTRVSREVGLEGKLGGQAQVKGVAGAWKDLTDNVNLMAGNLTNQVRGIAKVVTGVAGGDLKRKLALEAKGEIAALAETINEMIDTLATFADQVTGVAREVGVEGKLGGQATVPGAAGLWRDLTDNVNQLAANLTTQVRAIADVATAVTKGDLTRSIAVEARGEVAALKDTINEMIRNLRDTTLKNNEQDWLKTNLAKFSRMLQGQRDILTVSKMILSELAAVVSAQHGVFYLMEGEEGGEESVLKLVGSFAYKERNNLSNQFKLGEGVVGQCALEKERILLTNVPYEYIKISSGLGEARPVNIVVLPVIYEDNVKAVIELASFQSFSEVQLMFLDQLMESIGIVLNTIAASMRTEDLLKKSQSLTQDLQSQQDKLQKTNEELEEKAKLLSEQKTEVEKKNNEVELTKRALEEKAEQLSLTSKYKSEFLANMSHELRTPLNSLLILAKMLMENQHGNLTAKQVEFSHTIHSSGTELLALISEILDLSKIEAGKMAVEVGEVLFDDFRSQIRRNFQQIAQAKGINFEIELEDSLPSAMTTDAKRLHQVIKNLLSNAFKFTERGEVRLRIYQTERGWSPGHRILNSAEKVIAFSVADTGIGIPREKQQLIFEAFQQADGTTSRRFGGTGLGLTISREISMLLGGEIRVTSQPNKGSQFTFFLPQQYVKRKITRNDRAELKVVKTMTREEESNEEVTGETREIEMREIETSNLINAEIQVADDRENITAGDKVILIADDDPTFSSVILEVARQGGFKGVISLSGSNVISLARRFRPAAITLDIKMPDIDGWALLDRLKHDHQTRHIPVYLMSGRRGRKRALKAGALGFYEKPVPKETLSELFEKINQFISQDKRQLLIIEDDEVQRNSLVELIGSHDVETATAKSGEEALELLRNRHFDCIILDLKLPDISGYELLQKMEAENILQTPVMVYTGKELSSQEETNLGRYASRIIVKGVNSPERLLEETALFLHRNESKLPENNVRLLKQAQLSDPVLKGKRILIVDDDVRNIYALVSILENYQMKTYYAENGRDAIKLLNQIQDIDMVLMDIMMPDMDGYQTMAAIREIEHLKDLPIIAVTAKAMKGDRDKCIQAGADDYIAKPVEPEELFSLLRVYFMKDHDGFSEGDQIETA
jgi:CheY-like chemotaxis protein/HAMP domain-containing protein/putative methionine-R-sulfoxide reductase with GAF domain